MGMIKKALRPVTYRVEYVIMVTLGMFLRAFPYGVTSFLTHLLADIAFYVLRIRRDITMDNLRQGFGNFYSERELAGIARRAYVNIGLTFLEMLLVPKFAGHLNEMVDVSDVGVAKRLLEKGRGLVLVSGHFGSWELNGASLAMAGIPLHVVARRQANPYVDRLINRYREAFGMNVIALGAPIKHIVRALHHGDAVGLISDQDARHRGVFVTFFGRPASTPVGAAQLALKFGAPVLCAMTVRLKPGAYRTLFEEIEVRDDDTVETLTQRYTTAIENVIRQYPDQYFWMHKRWKTSEEDVRSARTSPEGDVD